MSPPPPLVAPTLVSATQPPPVPIRAGRRLTPEGKIWLLIVALLLLVGIAKSINLLALLGYVMLALLGLGGLQVGQRLHRLEARRILSDQLFANTSLHLQVRLVNTSTRPCPGVRIEDLGSDHAVGWFHDPLEGLGRRLSTAEILLPRRGWYDFAPLIASSTYPFGLWRRRVVIGSPSRVLLLPRPGKLSRDRLRHFLKGADPRGERTHRHGWRHEAAQADFHGLRPFRAGDSPRWIHWRTSARRGEIMVREFEDVPGDDLVLVVEPPSTPGESLEAIVNLAATVVWEWNQRRGDRFVLVVARTNPEILDGMTGPEHADRLLRYLALLTEQPAASSANLHSTPWPTTAACMVISAGPAVSSKDLDEHGRPTTYLDVNQQHEWGFYTPP